MDNAVLMRQGRRDLEFFEEGFNPTCGRKRPGSTPLTRQTGLT
jgi:hypothetical protein